MSPTDTGELTRWIASVLVLSLRIAPVFAFAPPFNLVPVPPRVRILLGLGLSAVLLSGSGDLLLPSLALPMLVECALRELLLGATIVMAFQIAFGALYLAGRTLDVQAGYGLALLIDPSSQAQTPLIGTLFAYAAAAVFFAVGGHIDLFHLIAASLQAMPLGQEQVPDTLAPLLSFISATLVIASGVAGGSILALFLVDAAIALLSRTASQMNVLVLGFQVKTLILLLVLPASFGLSGALLARLMRLTLDAIPRLL